ncbi:hypothetical protein DFH06DRAFT_1149546 [Mycena polygramma]|nr:hypothetical protein DFH06DRAFT_1149546 [Mycena polygramma]
MPASDADPPHPISFLGEARHNVDYFPGVLRHAPGARSFSLPFVNAAGDTFTAIVIGRVHDIVAAPWNRRVSIWHVPVQIVAQCTQCLILASPTDPTYKTSFSKTLSWSSNVTDLHLAGHPRLLLLIRPRLKCLEQNRPVQRGDEVECIVTFVREEFQSGGTAGAPMYKMVYQLLLVAIGRIRTLPPNSTSFTMSSTAARLNFLGDYEYLRHFYPGQERQSSDGQSFMTPYVRVDGTPFLTHIEGRVMDILSMGHGREILVLAKPIHDEQAQFVFKNAYEVAEEIVALDRSDTARLKITSSVAFLLQGRNIASPGVHPPQDCTAGIPYTVELCLPVTGGDRKYIPLQFTPVLDDSLGTAMSVQRTKDPASDAGYFGIVPVELIFTILSLVTMPDRVRLGATCQRLSSLCATFAQAELEVLLSEYYLDFKLLRFLIIATKSLMTGYALQSLFGGPVLQSDTIDFYTTPETTGDVVAFMMLASDYTPARSDIEGPWNVAWVLRRPHSKIRVLEFSIHHLTALLTGHMPHRMACFDGDFLRHPYAGLALDRVAVATPYALPLHLVRTEHKKVWSMLHKAIDHGFGWAFDYDSPHVCGVHPCCPTTPRTTTDAGWAHLRLPHARYGSAPQLLRASWSLCGTGCATGGFKGKGITTLNDEGTVPNPLWKAMPYVDYAWSHRANLTVVAVARHGDVAVRLAAEKIEFTVFGVVQSKFEEREFINSQQYEGYLRLSNPKWHGQGLAGSVLTTHYNQQLLALARALECHNLEAYHDTEDIMIKADNRPPAAVGSCVFATVTLTVHYAEELLQREEYYTLDLVEAKGALPLY